jgi:hypothetical protein
MKTLLAALLTMLALTITNGAWPAHADDLPLLGFSLGLCCTEPSGNNCLPDAKCIVDETCTQTPYTACAGDNGNADGVVRGTATTYPPTVTACDASSPFAGIESSYDPATGTYSVADALLKWDTSSLGTAGLEVTKAWLQLVTDNRDCAPNRHSISADDKAIAGEWYNWDEPVAGCDASDYGTDAGIPAFAPKSIRNTGCYQVILFDLQNLASINRTGTTYLCLHVTPDSTPTGRNVFEFEAIEQTYVAPTLFVNYTTADRGAATARFAARNGAQ